MFLCEEKKKKKKKKKDEEEEKEEGTCCCMCVLLWNMKEIRKKRNKSNGCWQLYRLVLELFLTNIGGRLDQVVGGWWSGQPVTQSDPLDCMKLSPSSDLCASDVD